MVIKNEDKVDKPHNHPIVERPTRWREKGCDCVGCLREDELYNYIEHLESELAAAKADSYSEKVKRLNKFEADCGL